FPVKAHIIAICGKADIYPGGNVYQIDGDREDRMMELESPENFARCVCRTRNRGRPPPRCVAEQRLGGVFTLHGSHGVPGYAEVAPGSPGLLWISHVTL
ncbi:uncharacterized protein PGTG_20375, partial [Puccinia graminis f. sp. tritici CRL 75-36-700-3]